MTSPAPAAIAIGSNLGDRLAHIRAAIGAVAALPDLHLTAISSTIETPALVPPGEPPGPDFLNAVIAVETGLGPEALLASLLQIERQLGRDRTAGSRWAARTVDLDLLFHGDAILRTDTLTLPHARLHEREFVLRPLAQVAPAWQHPILHLTAAEMLDRLHAQ